MQPIPSFVSRKEDRIPLQNQIEVEEHPFEDQFLVSASYESDQVVHLTVYRVDQIGGWGQSLRLKLWDVFEQVYETIEVGSSDHPKIERKYTSHRIRIIPFESSSFCTEIPRKIYQTSYFTHFRNESHYMAFLSLIELNPEYDYYHFSDSEARRWISEHYDREIVECYDILIPGAFKADFFRICILYKWGGCYFDHKHVLQMPLRTFFAKHPTVSSVYCKDSNPDLIHNGIIFSKAEQESMRQILQFMKNRIQSRWYPSHVFALTGPIALIPFVSERDKHLFFSSNHPFPFREHIKTIVDHQTVVFRTYPGYYHQDRREDYQSLFSQKKMYYQNYQICSYQNKEFTFMTIPELAPAKSLDIHNIYKRYKTRRARLHHVEVESAQLQKDRRPFPDRFICSILAPDSLQIHRVDQACGWGMDLKVIIIVDHQYHSLHIGSSSHREKRVLLPKELIIMD